MADRQLLSEDFLSQFVGIQPKNKGTLFDVVFLRTYSRYLPHLKRRETWLETIRRVVEYSMFLYTGPAEGQALINEAELMFMKLFHLEAYPAGRSFWIAGTESAKRWPESNFNCCVCVVDRLEVFGDVFHLLMLGCGVGFRICRKDVEKLPKLNTDIDVIHRPYNPRRKADRIEQTLLNSTQADKFQLSIGDSREGWVEAIRSVLRIMAATNKHITIEVDYDSVRPSGERIKGFGGRAAGPEGLWETISGIVQITKECNGTLTPVAAMDILNIIAKWILVGGVRRSSQIALGDSDDTEFIEAKVNLFTDEKKASKRHRTMSNNSLYYSKRPSKKELSQIFNRIKTSWEPGFLNEKAASYRRPWFSSVNPCGEALCADMGNCNLTGIVLTSHIKEDGHLNWSSLEESIRLAVRIGLRQTNITWSLSEWDKVHKRDRLLGVSITGIMDALDKLNIEFDSPLAIHLWQSLRQWANNEADKYAFEMRVPRPLLVTILKPEGSISQLPTVSSGLHRSWAPYYIRRIRVSTLDPVCKALQKLGVPCELDANKGERMVFSFPISTGAKSSANSEPAVRQLDRYLILMKHYVDHNASITVNVGDGEWDQIVDKVHENWDDIVACAFANKDYSQYPQLPYEEIDKLTYDQLMSSFPDLTDLIRVVNEFEEQEEEYELENIDCHSGQCPIR